MCHSHLLTLVVYDKYLNKKMSLSLSRQPITQIGRTFIIAGVATGGHNPAFCRNSLSYFGGWGGGGAITPQS